MGFILYLVQIIPLSKTSAMPISCVYQASVKNDHLIVPSGLTEKNNPKVSVAWADNARTNACMNAGGDTCKCC